MPPGMATPVRWPAGQAPQPVLCLRPTCQLSVDNADALAAAVSSRVQAVACAPCSVVLDLSATPVLRNGAAAALDRLANLMRDSHVTLRLVLPGAQARAAFFGGSAKSALGSVTVHVSTRAALLAACAALPGPAIISPAWRHLLAQPPEFLPVSAA